MIYFYSFFFVNGCILQLWSYLFVLLYLCLTGSDLAFHCCFSYIGSKLSLNFISTREPRALLLFKFLHSSSGRSLWNLGLLLIFILTALLLINVVQLFPFCNLLRFSLWINTVNFYKLPTDTWGYVFCLTIRTISWYYLCAIILLIFCLLHLLWTEVITTNVFSFLIVSPSFFAF